MNEPATIATPEPCAFRRDFAAPAAGLAPAREVGRALPGFSAVLAPTTLFLAATAVLSLHAGFEPAFFTQDPTSALGGHPLTGVQSQLGILGWWTAVSIGLFGYAVLSQRGSDAAAAAFLLGFGLFTMLLALDDLFRVHEDLARRHLGLRQRHLILAYGGICSWLLFRFRMVIARSEYAWLLLALVFFGISLAFDTFEPRRAIRWRWHIFFEDGFKLLGIVAWTTYGVRTGFGLLADRSPEARVEHGTLP